MLKFTAFESTILYDGSLPVQFTVQVAVDMSAFVVDRLLLVNFSSQGLDEPYVGVYSLLVVILHLTFLLVQTAEGVF